MGEWFLRIGRPDHGRIGGSGEGSGVKGIDWEKDAPFDAYSVTIRLENGKKGNRWRSVS